LSKRSKNQLSLQVLKKFRIIYGSVRQQFRGQLRVRDDKLADRPLSDL